VLQILLLVFSNYLPCVMVLTKFVVITAKNAKVSAKLAKALCTWVSILPISLQIRHEPAWRAVPK